MLGIARDAMVRVRAGVSYARAAVMDEGRCGLPEDDLLRTGVELLEATADRLTGALSPELQAVAVVADAAAACGDTVNRTLSNGISRKRCQHGWDAISGGCAG